MSMRLIFCPFETKRYIPWKNMSPITVREIAKTPKENNIKNYLSASHYKQWLIDTAMNKMLHLKIKNKKVWDQNNPFLLRFVEPLKKRCLGIYFSYKFNSHSLSRSERSFLQVLLSNRRFWFLKYNNFWLPMWQLSGFFDTTKV